MMQVLCAFETTVMSHESDLVKHTVVAASSGEKLSGGEVAEVSMPTKSSATTTRYRPLNESFARG